MDPAQADPVDYTADRGTGKPPQERGSDRVREDTMPLAGLRTSDPALPVRRVLVHSAANATARQAARTRRLAKAAEDLNTLARTTGTRHRPTTEAVAERAAGIPRARKVHAIVHTRITADPDAGNSAVTWRFDRQVLEAEAAADGWYALLAYLDPAQADAAEVLIRYQGQQVVERPERRLRGFHTDSRAGRPTGRLVFTALGRLQLIPGTSTDPPQVPPPQGIHARLFPLLNVDPNRPRHLASSIPTCEERD